MSFYFFIKERTKTYPKESQNFTTPDFVYFSLPNDFDCTELAGPDEKCVSYFIQFYFLTHQVKNATFHIKLKKNGSPKLVQ